MNDLLPKSSAPTDVNLEAVLLNVNLRSSIPREAIKPASLRRYQTYIATGEATIKLPSGEYRLTVDFKDGNALLHLWREHQLMSVAGVATGPIGASELWEFLVGLHDEQSGLPEPEPPHALPWLALHFTAEFVATADTRMFRQLSALHWVLGWAVLEHVAEQQRRN
jgi:hypothetical protein